MRRLLTLIAVGSLVALHAATAAGETARDKDVFVGSIRGAYQLADPADSAKLRSTDRVGLFMTSLGLFHALYTKTEDWHGSDATAKGIVAAFRRTGPGIIEGNLDHDTTPSVPPQHWNYTRDDDWQAWAARIGWTPSIFLLNMNAHGTAATTLYTAADVQDVRTGTRDIEKGAPYIKLVLPYLSPNTGVYGSWAEDPYWSTARQVALEQGGFVIDVPVGYYLNNPPAYQKVVQDQIHWAIRHRLVVGVLLSPCSTDPRDWTVVHSCSFSADPHFMNSTKEVVSRLEKAKAAPTMWLIDNYSEQSVSPYPGTDDNISPSYNPNTILAVGFWIAEHAKTSPYPHPVMHIERGG